MRWCRPRKCSTTRDVIRILTRRDKRQRERRRQHREHVLRAPREARERRQARRQCADFLFVHAEERAPAESPAPRRSAARARAAKARGERRRHDHGDSRARSGPMRASPEPLHHRGELRQRGPGGPRQRRRDSQNDVQLRDQHHARRSRRKIPTPQRAAPRDVPPQPHHAEPHHDDRGDDRNFGGAADPLIPHRERDEGNGGAGRAADQNRIAAQQRDDRRRQNGREDPQAPAAGPSARPWPGRRAARSVPRSRRPNSRPGIAASRSRCRARNLRRARITCLKPSPSGTRS